MLLRVGSVLRMLAVSSAGSLRAAPGRSNFRAPQLRSKLADEISRDVSC